MPETIHHVAERHDEHVPRLVPTQRARQGATTGHVRYVLVFSLLLCVAAGFLLWKLFFG